MRRGTGKIDCRLRIQRSGFGEILVEFQSATLPSAFFELRNKPTHGAVWWAENEPSLDVWEPAATL